MRKCLVLLALLSNGAVVPVGAATTLPGAKRLLLLTDVIGV